MAALKTELVFLREITHGIRSATRSLSIGVRLSIFDFLPFCMGEDGIGIPENNSNAEVCFGGDSTGTGVDLTEPLEFMNLLRSLNINLVCTTAGSPYYNPHIQRPAFFLQVTATSHPKIQLLASRAGDGYQTP